MSKLKLTYKKSASSQRSSNANLSKSNSNCSLNSSESFFVNKGSNFLQRPSPIKRPSSYLSLSRSTTNDDYVDEQFEKPPSRIPTKSICLAAYLCFAGLSLLIFGIMGMMDFLDPQYKDSAWPLIGMGTLMFIPGAYHVWIAYNAYRGTPGYSFEDIPEFE